ncbi:MAG: hypothetical protein KGK07_07930 [Chloroflexota bacterium]|nr:hypothetical protein [Chloroflexota bacterium]
MVAASALFDDAVAELSMEAMAFLWRVHSGDAPEIGPAARALLRRLRGTTRGAGLHELRAWQDNITTWRAVARHAGADVPWM